MKKAEVERAQNASTPNASSDKPVTPWGVLLEAVRAVPAVKYALGVAGVASAAAIAIAFFKSPVAALLATIVMFALMAVLYVFTRLVAAEKQHAKGAGLAMMWLCLGLFFFWSVCLTLSVFFDWPKPLPALLGRLLDTPKAATGTRETGAADPPVTPETVMWRSSSDRITLEDLPVSARTPLAEIGTEKAGTGASDLAQRPTIVLDGTTLLIRGYSPSVTHTLYARRLELRNGARIVTNGNSIALNVLSIASYKADQRQPDIVSFEDGDVAPLPSESSAGGQAGRPGGRVTIRGGLDSTSSFRIDLRGQDGGPGSKGARGADGAPGTRGADGSDSLIECKRSGGNGGSGSPGQDGGPGGRGGDGGAGGALKLSGAIVKQLAQITFTSLGGQPGKGGMGGEGGKGGAGGPGGSGSVYCRGGHSGPSGQDGRPGPAGLNGETGRPEGQVEVVEVSIACRVRDDGVFDPSIQPRYCHGLAGNFDPYPRSTQLIIESARRSVHS